MDIYYVTGTVLVILDKWWVGELDLVPAQAFIYTWGWRPETSCPAWKILDSRSKRNLADSWANLLISQIRRAKPRKGQFIKSSLDLSFLHFGPVLFPAHLGKPELEDPQDNKRYPVLRSSVGFTYSNWTSLSPSWTPPHLANKPGTLRNTPWSWASHLAWCNLTGLPRARNFPGSCENNKLRIVESLLWTGWCWLLTISPGWGGGEAGEKYSKFIS